LPALRGSHSNGRGTRKRGREILKERRDGPSEKVANREKSADDPLSRFDNIRGKKNRGGRRESHPRGSVSSRGGKEKKSS